MGDVRSEEEHLEALYISYDGLLEPLGQSQVVPYVRSLAKRGVRTTILSFEKPGDLGAQDRVQALRKQLDFDAVRWVPLRYHRHPRVAATTLDLAWGIVTAIRTARAHRPHVVHARSYVAGVMGWSVKLLFGTRFVFDTRGFWPEERVELGLFRSQSLLYRISKRLEHRLLETADAVVVLTESARAILRDREASSRLASRRAREKQITVIPCCVDLNRFHPRPPDAELIRLHGLENQVVIGNIGAVNPRYMLAEMLRFAFHLKSHRPESRFVYLTRQDGRDVRTAARDAGLREDDLLVLSAEPEEVPRWLSLFRLGIFFLRPSYAAKASSYTKLAEFLASGVPVVTNTGVGDVDKILETGRSGILVSGMRDTDLAAAARQSLELLQGDRTPEEVRQSCRATASAHFALHEGAERYLAIYRALAFPDEERSPVPIAVGLG